MIARDFYLKKILEFKNTDLIKVISGIRRCGKSTLLELFAQYLLKQGAQPAQIIRINFELLDFDSIKNYKDLHSYILQQTPKKQTQYYILLDEVQKITNWEKAVNSLRLRKNCDIYITGSNAFLLNPEAATLLAGRYIEIKVQPLSFKEYLLFRQQENIEAKGAFDQYITYGGMPGTVQFLSRAESLKKYLSSICDTVLYRDVIQKNKVRDPHMLEDVLYYGADNVGNILSTKKITDYLNSNGKKASFETVDKYLRMLEQAYIFTRARRFDIKGKAWFKTNDKYFLADTGLRNQLIGFRGKDYGHLLENIVFNELQLRNSTVAIGKYNDLEVDFVTIDFGQRKYYQLTTSMLDPKAAERELKVLRAIPDDYPKIILTLDEHNIGDFEGIKVINVIKWLMAQP